MRETWQVCALHNGTVIIQPDYCNLMCLLLFSKTTETRRVTYWSNTPVNVDTDIDFHVKLPGYFSCNQHPCKSNHCRINCTTGTLYQLSGIFISMLPVSIWYKLEQCWLYLTHGVIDRAHAWSDCPRKILFTMHMRTVRWIAKRVNIHFLLINTPDCSTCLFSSYGLLITVGGVGVSYKKFDYNALTVTTSPTTHQPMGRHSTSPGTACHCLWCSIQIPSALWAWAQWIAHFLDNWPYCIRTTWMALYCVA